MTIAYDNWERLVRATLRREELWQLCHDHSRTPSDSSTKSTASAATSPAGSSSPIPENSSSSAADTSRSISLLSDQKNDRPAAGAESKTDKPMMTMRRKKSIIRLDRWLLTRWLSNTFRSTDSIGWIWVGLMTIGEDRDA